MKIDLTPCYILHQRAYRETSLILEIFSREHGRLALVAKGAKRKNNSNGNLMQANQKLNVGWSIRGEMGTLTTIETAGASAMLTGHKIIFAFYLNELLMRMLHKHESHPHLFDAYDEALRLLGEQQDEQAILRNFEKNLLSSLGYGLILDHDVISGNAIQSQRDYYYQIDCGPMINVPSSSDYITVSGRTLIELNQGKLTTRRSLQESKQLMRFTLKRHLGTKPLASRELYQAYLETIQ